MSRAFVKDDDPQWLHDIQPSMHALCAFLRNENNGRPIHEQSSYIESGREYHVMSNGLVYFINEKGQWEVYLDEPSAEK